MNYLRSLKSLVQIEEEGIDPSKYYTFSKMINDFLRPICLQCHKEMRTGPKLFYEKMSMFELYGDYGEAIIKKIEDTFPTLLFYQKETETNLIWMMGVAPICIICNDWMNVREHQIFLRENNNITDVIAYIAFHGFFKSTINFFYPNHLEKKNTDGRIEVIPTMHELLTQF